MITPALHNTFVSHGPLFAGDLIELTVYRETGNLAMFHRFSLYHLLPHFDRLRLFFPASRFHPRCVYLLLLFFSSLFLPRYRCDLNQVRGIMYFMGKLQFNFCKRYRRSREVTFKGNVLAYLLKMFGGEVTNTNNYQDHHFPYTLYRSLHFTNINFPTLKYPRNCSRRIHQSRQGENNDGKNSKHSFLEKHLRHGRLRNPATSLLIQDTGWGRFINVNNDY